MAAAWPEARDGAAALTMAAQSLRLTDARGDVRPLDELERESIRFAISHYRGQMSEVARRLGIGRSTLYRKLEGLGLDAGGADAELNEGANAV
jgi:DNA-binding NtrC family response regulator